MMKKHCSCSHCCASFFKWIRITSEKLVKNLGVSSSQVTLQATRSNKLTATQRTFLGSRLLVLPPCRQIISYHDIYMMQLHLCRTKEFLCLNPIPHSGQEKAFSVLCTFIWTWNGRLWTKSLDFIFFLIILRTMVTLMSVTSALHFVHSHSRTPVCCFRSWLQKVSHKRWAVINEGDKNLMIKSVSQLFIS